jgi:hypothetical protein
MRVTSRAFGSAPHQRDQRYVTLICHCDHQTHRHPRHVAIVVSSIIATHQTTRRNVIGVTHRVIYSKGINYRRHRRERPVLAALIYRQSNNYRRHRRSASLVEHHHASASNTTRTARLQASGLGDL